MPDITHKTILVTGAAGFIGFHLSKRLLESGIRIIGFDNINSYYDPSLKHARLDILNQYPDFTFIKGDLADRDAVNAIFDEYHPEIVVNLAAQAGVRYSIENPQVYIFSGSMLYFSQFFFRYAIAIAVSHRDCGKMASGSTLYLRTAAL